jgi:hypothetical protein
MLQGLHKFAEKNGNCEPATVNGYLGLRYFFSMRFVSIIGLTLALILTKVVWQV